MTRHEFLAELHRRLQPRTYLEIGVQFGTSLNLAHAAERAIGIDPAPLVEATGNQTIFHYTSDSFFASPEAYVYSQLDDRKIDLAFIDGMHLFEYALRDFMNIERYCWPGSVVVFDDVFPRNQYEARRLQPGENVVGDWTGDVWKVMPILLAFHPGSLIFRKVDTQPTGTFVATCFPLAHKSWTLPWALTELMLAEWQELDAPTDVLNRAGAVQPEQALALIDAEAKQWRL